MWLEIFKVGTFTDSRGKTASYSANNIAEIVLKYNSEVSENGYSAPLVKGHPPNDAPAHGWVERLARRGNIILAKIKGMSNEIIQEIKQGKYKKVSIALSPDLLLRHVGLLGAAQPAVQGLKDVSFEDNGDYLLFSLELTQQEIEQDSQVIESLQSEIEKLKAENKQLKKIDASRRNREFAESFFDKNSYLQKSDFAINKILSLLDKADDANNDSEFSAAPDLKADLIEFFDALKPSSLFKPINITAAKPLSNNEFEGKNVVEDRLDLHNKALALLASFPEMTYESAIHQVISR